MTKAKVRGGGMIVMKFGGTSVGIPTNFRVALGLVSERTGQDPVVVVSALSGVTNLLVDFCRDVAARRDLAARLRERHAAHARELGLATSDLLELVDQFGAEADRLVASRHALVGADRDAWLAWGERLSAALFAAGLNQAGTPARAVLAGDAGLVTDEHFGAAHPLPESEALLR